MKKLLVALAAFFVAFSPLASSAGHLPSVDISQGTIVAMDRTQHLTGLNPPSTWMNQEQRDVRIGVGSFWWNMFCGSNTTCGPYYSNLSVFAVTGLFVAVGPTSANTVGTVYQFLAEETSGYGGYPSGVGTFLATDNTKVVLQGTSTANTANIGPLVAGSSGGQSVDNLIECQVQTVDATSQPVNIVSPGGSVTSTSANRDRKDIVACQSKAGTSATTGTQTVPTVDAGWVAVGYVAIANGTVTITGGMINAITTSQFNGVGLLATAGATPIDTSSTAQTKSGTLAVNSLTVPSNSNVTGNYVNIGTTGVNNAAVGFGNSTGLGGQSTIIGSSSSTVLGVTGSLLTIANTSSNTTFAMDGSGNAAILGRTFMFGLDVAGASQITAAALHLGIMTDSGGGSYFRSGSNATFYFQNGTGSTSYATISSTGITSPTATVVNTITGSQFTSGSALAVDTSGNGGFAGVLHSVGSVSSVFSSVGSSATNAVANTMLMETDGTNGLFRLGTAGQYYFENASGAGYYNVNGGAYTNVSDRRFKRDIHAVPYGLETVMAMKPASFVWKDSGKHDVGFIAQDMQKIVPEIVSVMNKKNGTLGINYAGITPVLAHAIQQQQHEIEALWLVAAGEPLLMIVLVAGFALRRRNVA